MKPSSAPKNISPAKARNAVFLNLLATPGLGSLAVGRLVAGTGQLALALAGFALVMAWFVKILVPYYDLMFVDIRPPPINWGLGEAGLALFVAAWGWSLVTSISIYQAASQANLEALKHPPAGPDPAGAARIPPTLSAVPGWIREDRVISRTFEFPDFPQAMKFVNAVAALAEQAQHHPDIDVRWNKVVLALTTHDAGGLTEKDFALARACNALVAI